MMQVPKRSLFLIIVLAAVVLSGCDNSEGDRFAFDGDSYDADCGDYSPYYMPQGPFESSTWIGVRLNVFFISERPRYWRPDIQKLVNCLRDGFRDGEIHFDVNHTEAVQDKGSHSMMRYRDDLKRYMNDTALTILVYDHHYRSDFAGAAYEIISGGLVIRRALKGKSTICHEVGHCFGLLHTHEPDDSDYDGYSSGDFICRTPNTNKLCAPRLGLLGMVDHNCQFTGDTGLLNSNEVNRLIENYMSYSSVDCRHVFEQDQYDLMRMNLATHPLLNKMTYEILY